MIVYPSTFLPSLPVPPLLLLSSLKLLSDFLLPQKVIDLRVGVVQSPTHEESDAFELKYSRNWLELVLQFNSKLLVKAVEDVAEAELENIISITSNLLSSISGHCAAGASKTTYLFSVGSLVDDITISISNGTLVSDGTGFRTWGAAPLLSAYCALHHQQIFTKSEKKLQILELGSGTGLAGITIAAILSGLGRKTKVTMSDFEDLRNLERNVLENHKLLENVETVVKHLDWSTFHTLPTATETRPQERFDLIFAADVIFEKNHTEWIHATVSTLLAFPTFNSDPTFYVILQLRTSHFRDLLNEFEQAFSELSSGFIDSIDEDRVRWKLRIRQKKKLKGSNGFSSENDEQNYLLFEIRWASIDS